MEPECSLPHSTVPSTCPYPQPDPTTPCPPPVPIHSQTQPLHASHLSLSPARHNHSMPATCPYPQPDPTTPCQPSVPIPIQKQPLHASHLSISSATPTQLLKILFNSTVPCTLFLCSVCDVSCLLCATFLVFCARRFLCSVCDFSCVRCATFPVFFVRLFLCSVWDVSFLDRIFNIKFMCLTFCIQNTTLICFFSVQSSVHQYVLQWRPVSI
jgi:hypothetical protein